jgi:hypothetical protein
MHSMVVHFLLYQEFTKVDSTMLNIEILWYHKFNSNKIHESKAIKFILIGAHLHIPNIYTFRKKKLCQGLMKLWFNFNHSKVLN